MTQRLGWRQKHIMQMVIVNGFFILHGTNSLGMLHCHWSSVN
jgi:hypothetical protein